MKTGLFGGTFNPVHSGHVRIATDILASFGLDSITVVPAAAPPHKLSDVIVDISHRFEMTRLAFEPYPQISISNVEVTRSDRSYTIDTVNYFLTARPSGTEIYLIMGLDAFLELDTWKSYMTLLEKVPVIIIKRPLADDRLGQDALNAFLRLKISDAYTFSPETSCYQHRCLRPIYFHKTPEINISSSEIRRRLKTGRPVTNMIPEAVEKYIKTKGLYQ